MIGANLSVMSFGGLSDLSVLRSTLSRNASNLPVFALPLAFVLVPLVGLLIGSASLGETVSFAAALLGIGLLRCLLPLATQRKP